MKLNQYLKYVLIVTRKTLTLENHLALLSVIIVIKNGNNKSVVYYPIVMFG